MDFGSLNKFNVIVNSMSGNFLPLTDENTEWDYAAMVYSIFIWFIIITYLITTVVGLLCYLPTLQALRVGGTAIVICIEVIWLVTYLTYQRKYYRNFIRKINSILVDSDDLRRCIGETIKPYEKLLKLYIALTMSAWVAWEAMPIKRIFQTDQFTHTDFTLATYIPGAPFNTNIFVLGIIFRMIGSFYVMLKKIGIDVYINYTITLLTAEYRYLQQRTTAALREKDDILVLEALKKCVVSHHNTMNTGAILVNLLSINIGVTYINCIIRMCCIALMCMLPESNVFRSAHAVFMIGLLVQVYILCSCIQDLLEASTSIANEAFYEQWYEHSRAVRCMLHTIGLGNKMECRLSAFGIFDLQVPTVATILKQSYSACLLLMKFQ